MTEDENSIWKDKYTTLADYYAAEYSKTYKILDPETLSPLSDNEVVTKFGVPNSFPCFTLEPMEIEIDPDIDPELFTIQEDDPPAIKQEKRRIHREEIKRCINSFPYFCHRYIKIIHPVKGLVPFVLYNYQRRVVENYNTHRFNIISKFRQAGLTTVTSIWLLWRCMFRKNQIIMLMSKTDREAMTAANMVANAIDWLPDWLQPVMAKNNEHSKEFKQTGSRIDFQGPQAARSKALTYMVLDEAAHIPDMAKHWEAMSPTLFTGGNCIALSTVYGLGNWYQETFYNARVNKNKFHIIELDFWENPDYNNPEWVADQKLQLGEKGWEQEVLRSFLGSGDTYIPAKVIEELDHQVKDLYPARIKFSEWINEKDDFYPERGGLWIWKEPVDGHEYTIAVDAADGMGDEGDNSCFEILDNSTMEQVCEFYSNRIPPNIFSKLVSETAIYYNMALVVVEHNAPAGGAVMAGLKDICMYENLYYGGTSNTSRIRNQPGIKTNQQIRPMVLEALQNRLLQRSLKINSPRFVHELKTFIYNASKKRAEAQKGRHDDAVMAMAIAVYIRDQQMKDIPVGAEVPKELMDIFKSEIYEEIKKELQDGAPENWIEEEEDLFDAYAGDVSPGVVFNVKRKFDKLLKEFDW